LGHAVLEIMQTPPDNLAPEERLQIGLKRQLLGLGVVAALLRDLPPPLGRHRLI
jgi:hypothetical protein